MADDPTSNDVFLGFGPETPHTAAIVDLLQSELFADVEVRFEDNAFYCHRALLGTHSEWFLDNMEQSWIIDGDLPYHIKIPDEVSRGELTLIIDFIYASRVNLITYLGYQTRLESIIRVWRLAHYFRIDSLKVLALEAFQNSIDHWYKTYGDHVRTNTVASFPADMITLLTDAIAALYRDNRIDALHVFRSPLLATALCGIYLFRTNADMTSLLASLPAFAADWTRVLMHRGTNVAQPSGNHPMARPNFYQDADFVGNFSPITTETGPACAQCHKEFDQVNSKPYPNLMKWAKKQVYEELCWNCSPKITLEEWLKA